MQGVLDELHRQGFSEWDSLVRELSEAWNRENQIQSVTITSALTLTDVEQRGFAEKLKHADITYEVDPRLIAGVRITWSDRVLDSSALGMIANLRNVLTS